MERALKVEKTRFDTKLTKVQKELFELATKIGGYRTLTDFMLSTAEEKAKRLFSSTKPSWLLKEIKKSSLMRS